MPKNIFFSFVTYLFFGVIIFSWWALVFRESSSFPYSYDPPSPPIDRDQLQQALSGDFALAIDLITAWDLEAIRLQKNQIQGIERLSPQTYLQAQLFSKILSKDSKHASSAGEKPINIASRFLPQTYVAASFLLAIAPPHEIVALPRGMRSLPQLYSKTLLEQIPLSADRFYSEQLFLADPHLAFVAPYSHPATLEALKRQNIRLHCCQNIDKVSDISIRLLEIGQVTNHSVEANLLAILIEAGLLAIDNQIRALSFEQTPDNQKRTCLYICYFHHYRIPGIKSLTGQLLARALSKHSGIECPVSMQNNDWFVPINNEQMDQIDPDNVIVSIPFPQDKKGCLAHMKQLKHLRAVQNKQIFFVDEAVQDSPTQYIVLAYYDLCRTLARIK